MIADDGIYTLKTVCRNEREAEEVYKAICGEFFSNVVMLRYFGEPSEVDLAGQSAYIEKIQEIEDSLVDADGEADAERLVDVVYQEVLKAED